MKKALMVALAGLLLTGCGGGDSGKLRVGVLNTARIVEEDPAFKDLRLDIMREKSAYLKSLPEDPTQLSKAKWDELQKESRDKQSEWEKKVMTFISQSVKQITTVTEGVAKQRNLDMVVINTPYTNAVQYTSGPDVTLDVLLKMTK